MIRVVLTNAGVVITHQGISKYLLTEDRDRELCLVQLDAKSAIPVKSSMDEVDFEAPEMEIRDQRTTDVRDVIETMKPGRRKAGGKRRRVKRGEVTAGTGVSQERLSSEAQIRRVRKLLREESADLTKKQRVENTKEIARKVYGSDDFTYVMRVAGVRAHNTRKADG